jgi:hypothetical protein
MYDLTEFHYAINSISGKYTKWLLNTIPVYLPDRKHIRLIKT